MIKILLRIEIIDGDGFERTYYQENDKFKRLWNAVKKATLSSEAYSIHYNGKEVLTDNDLRDLRLARTDIRGKYRNVWAFWKRRCEAIEDGVL